MFPKDPRLTRLVAGLQKDYSVAATRSRFMGNEPLAILFLTELNPRIRDELLNINSSAGEGACGYYTVEGVSVEIGLRR